MDGESHGGADCPSCKKLADRAAFRQDPDPGIEAWEQQPSEPPVYFEIFDRFRLMHSDRSVRGAVQEFYVARGQTPPDQIEARFYAAAKRWRWEARADAFWRRENRRIEKLLEKDRLRDRKLRLLAARIARQKFIESIRELDARRLRKTSPVSLIDAFIRLNEEIRKETLDTPEDRKERKAESPDTFELPRLEDRLNEDE